MSQKLFLGNSLDRWLAAAAVFVILLAVLIIARKMLCGRLGKRARRTSTPLDDFAVGLLDKTGLFFLFAVSFYFGSLSLALPGSTKKIIQEAVVLSLLLQAAVWGSSAITFWITRYKSAKGEDAAGLTSFKALGFLLRLILWSFILLVAFDNLGIKITTLITGLGIGGVAVALAVQNILGDLFASLSIVFDKPFVAGDYIVIDDLQGTVERIGLKTTRIRSLSGEQLIFANNDLLKSRIRNFQRMDERRAVFSVNVAYWTPPGKLARIPEIIREVIESREKARFERAHFKAFGDSALQFETVYWVLDPRFNTFMDVQQAVNLDIIARFKEEGIEFAYPTHTVFMGPDGR